MKNIHVLTTSKPSRLLRGLDGITIFENEVSPDNEWCVNVNIHITNDEEIKDGDKRINNYQRKPKGEEIPSKKIILTTDQDLIKDGVQEIPDEFLEWFVKNPSCEFVKVNDLYNYTNENTEHIGYKIIIPQEEPKRETLEEAAEKYENSFYEPNGTESVDFIAGAKWQAERMHSEEEVLEIIRQYAFEEHLITSSKPDIWFKQFKNK